MSLKLIWKKNWSENYWLLKFWIHSICRECLHISVVSLSRAPLLCYRAAEAVSFSNLTLYFLRYCYPFSNKNLLCFPLRSNFFFTRHLDRLDASLHPDNFWTTLLQFWSKSKQFMTPKLTRRLFFSSLCSWRNPRASDFHYYVTAREFNSTPHPRPRLCHSRYTLLRRKNKLRAKSRQLRRVSVYAKEAYSVFSACRYARIKCRGIVLFFVLEFY